MPREENTSQSSLQEIDVFHRLFEQHESALKSYLYRLLTNREDVEDFYHNTFLQAFQNIASFRGTEAQFKSWIFTIATRLAYNHLKKEKKWTVSAQDVCRDSLQNNPKVQQSFFRQVSSSPHNQYDIREHIDFCFTCINKTLSIEQQVALLLKDVLGFKVKETALIMDKSEGQVKHYLIDARKTMSSVFEKRCALVNKEGVCHQCAELQGIFNPKSKVQEAAMEIQLVKDAGISSKEELFQLRKKIVRSIQPLDNPGADLHDHLMQHMKKVNEIH